MLLLISAAAGAVAAEGHRLVVGLRTLIAPDAAAGARSGGGGHRVATRTIAASPRAVGCPGGGGDKALFVGEEEEEGKDEEEEEGGCWVMYGWRRRLRRLPPLIPSLRWAGSAPWALARTRTADGRLVVSMEPAPPRGRVVARKVNNRLVLNLVERDDNAAPLPPPPLRRRSLPSIAQEPDAPSAADVEEASAELGIARRGVPTTAAEAPPVLFPEGSSSSRSPPPPPLPSVARPPLVCAEGFYDDVIRSSSLPKMPLIIARMVH